VVSALACVALLLLPSLLLLLLLLLLLSQVTPCRRFAALRL
jgi:hypothetical protein